MIKKLLSFLTLFTLLISPAFAEELEGFYYYYQLPEIYYETKSSKTTVDEAILQAIQKGEYHELETLLETSTSKVDPKTAERLVELVKNNRLKEAEELFETGSTSASEWVGETSTSWSGIRYDTGVSLGNQAKKMSKKQVEELLGDSNWHANSIKNKIANAYKKDLRGSSNFDFYRAKNGDIYIQGNKSSNRIKIDIERFK